MGFGWLGTPQSSAHESSAATATDLLLITQGVICGAQRAYLCFMAPSGCHTSGNQKGATPEIEIDPFYLRLMPES